MFLSLNSINTTDKKVIDIANKTKAKNNNNKRSNA